MKYMGRVLTFTLLLFLLGNLILPALSGGTSDLPASELSTVASDDFIAVNSRGILHNESNGSARYVYTTPLYSLANGQNVGTATFENFCSPSAMPPCLVYEVIATFRLPQGEIRNHMVVSAAPDPRRSGFIFVGARPEADTILSGTGAFAGRTGRIRQSGTVDATKAPLDHATIDNFYVIELNPR